MSSLFNELRPVLDNYDIQVKKVIVETLKEKKAVWWIYTDNGKYILKKVAVSKNRLIFLLSAVTHLRNNGVIIPAIITTKQGNLFVEDDEKIYILMEAIPSRTPNASSPRELALILNGMAQFHVSSKNFIPPAEASLRSHLGKWEKNYQGLVSGLENFKKIALTNKEKPFEQFYLSHCDYFIKEGKACLTSLNDPTYKNWVTKVQQEINLCHQDFAPGNLGLYKGTLYVYDIDSITFDLPARDIRKILNKVMKKRGSWDSTLTNKMLSSYHEINPLTPDEWSIVFVDIRFPHLFHGIASKYFERREQEWPMKKYLMRLKELTKVEMSKITILDNQEDIIDFLVGKKS